MIKLIVIRDTFNLNPVTRTGEDITELMIDEFGDQLPSGAVFYIDEVQAGSGFTVNTADDVTRLKSASLVYCVIEPQGIETLIAIAVGSLVSLAVTFLLAPKPPEGGGGAAPSPNQSLSRRTNQERLGGRVPDNLGRQLTIPDLIAPTYKVFIDHREVEYSLMCLGRGHHQIHGATDENTPFEQLSGANLSIFDPGFDLTSTPSYQIGQTYSDTELLYSQFLTKRYSSVNGQVLEPEEDYLILSDSIRFVGPNILELNDHQIDFTAKFKVGDPILIEGVDSAASNQGPVDHDSDMLTPEITRTYNLNGSFTVQSLSASVLTLTNPGAQSSDWQSLADNADATVYTSATISAQNENLWEGYHYTDQDGATDLLLNVIAPNGLYKGAKNSAISSLPLRVFFVVEFQAVDKYLVPIEGTFSSKEYAIEGRAFQGGPTQNQSNFRTNDDQPRRTAAKTIRITTPHAGRCRFRVRRFGRQIKDSDRAVIDEVRIRDFMSAKKLSGDRETVFADETVLTTLQRATESALAFKERQLKVDCTRYVNLLDGGFGPSELAPDIIYHVATDPKIGRLSPAQIDTTAIRAEFDAHAEYFGSDIFQRISLTLSDSNESAETTLARIADLVFGYCYYFANQMRFYFERPVPAPAVIFTSYNTAPRSITKESATGVDNERDGIEITYIDNSDGLQRSLIYPADAINAAKIDMTGCASEEQATAHMMRKYQKLMYQRTKVTGEFLDESNVLVRGNAVICADNAQDVNVQSGQVISIDAATMIMQLSHPVVLAEGENHSLRVQLISGVVDSIPVTAGPDAYSLTLGRLPAGALSVYEDNNVVAASYDVVSSTDAQRHWYLTESIQPVGVNSNTVEMVNYDERYYEHDRDHLNA